MATPSGPNPTGAVDTDVVGRLEALLLDALALPCVTGEEGPMAEWVVARCAGEPVRRSGHSVVVGDLADPRPLVLLVAHLDVVPPTDADATPRIEADHIVGRGSSDMKSGLVVALDVLADDRLRAGAVNPVLVAYAGEEGPHEGNELATVLTEVPELTRAELAIVLEPTDLEVQLGCLGGLHAEVAFRGRAAHSARPWFGENALTAAGAFLAGLHARDPEEVPVDGLVYRDVWSATRAWTDNARNVIPDRFTVNLNYRFSPRWTLEEAEERLRAVLAGAAEGADVTIVDRAPPAPPHRTDPRVAQFTEVAADVLDAPIRPKQAWTDVARFAEFGVPALNFGPGLTAQAHQRGEHVPRANLVPARDVVARFLQQATG